MFSPVSRGGQNFWHNHQQLCTSWMVQFADGVVTFWAGLPVHPVLVFCELGWPDAEHLAMGRLLFLLGRSFSMAQGLGCPLPATVLSVASHSPGTWAHHALAMCAHLDITSPLATGIHPQSPPHRVRRWVDLVVSPSLNLALQKPQSTVSPRPVFPMVPRSLSMLAMISSCMAEEISPEHARFWSLARWVMTLPCGRPARHLGLPESCRFCDASVGDLWHSMSECREFADLRTQMSRRCRISPQFAQAWSRHSWISFICSQFARFDSCSSAVSGRG